MEKLVNDIHITYINTCSFSVVDIKNKNGCKFIISPFLADSTAEFHFYMNLDFHCKNPGYTVDKEKIRLRS